MFAIKSPIRRKTEQMFNFLTPNFCERRDFSTAVYQSDLPSTVWQSLVEFRLLISVCEAWQWNSMHNLRRWVKWTSNFKLFVDQSLWHFGTMYETPCSFNTLADYVHVYRVSFRRYRPLKSPLSCEVVAKGGFWAPDL